jgi:aminopeptidase N
VSRLVPRRARPARRIGPLPASGPASGPVLGLVLAPVLALAACTSPVSPSPDAARSAAASPAGTVHARAVPGADGAGDPYFPLDGNGGYDVRRYVVKDTYRPESGRLTGRTTVVARATRALSSFSLDLVLDVAWVRVDGASAAYRRPSPHELRVGHRLRKGERFRVVVRYSGRPGSIRAAGVSPFLDGYDEGYALGEPQIGPWWFAANETPRDRARFDVRMRVPRGFQAIGGGELVDRSRTRRWSTWRWRVDQPVATYLAFFAVGRFALSHEEVDGLRYRYAVSKRLQGQQQANATALLRRTPGVVGWLGEQLGSYPFAESGGVVAGRPLGFALETAGRPVYPFLGGPTERAVSVLVHEQAHQWFGDSVGLRRWRDIWLHEGFATYAEWWYAEAHGGRTVEERLTDEYAFHRESSGFWKVQLSDPGAHSLFTSAVYVRGAMTLAALRQRVGTTAMADLLRRWATRHRGETVTTRDFRAFAEEVTGEDLDGFFSAWLDEPVKPAATDANGL